MKNREKEIKQNLTDTIELLFNLSEEKTEELVNLAIKDKDIHEIVLHSIDYPNCSQAIGDYEEIVLCTLEDLLKTIE